MDNICHNCQRECAGGMFCNYCGKALVVAAEAIEVGFDNLALSESQMQLLPSVGSFENVIFSRKRSSDMNLVLLGKSGVGKSTWINSFVNFLKHNTFENAQGIGPVYSPIYTQFHHADQSSDAEELTKRLVTITLGIKENLGDEYAKGNVTASATDMPMCHKVIPRNNSYCINLIDTPGVCATSGVNKLDNNYGDKEKMDKGNLNAILNFISQYEYINAFIILLKPDEERLEEAFAYSLKVLFGQLHDSAKNNVIFAFTHANYCNFDDTKTILVLDGYLKQIGLDIKITQSNVFYFDSTPFRYLATYYKGYKPKEEYIIVKYCWDKSIQSCEKLIRYVDDKLKPHETSSTISIYEAKWMIVSVLKPLVQICKVNEENIAANNSGRTVVKNIKEKTLVYKKLDRPMTVCTNAKCCKQQQVFENGCNIIRNIYEPTCCGDCRIPFVSNEQPGSFTLYLCDAMHLGKCKVCKHHKNEHMHVTYELFEAEKLYEMPERDEMETKDIKAKMKLLTEEMMIIVSTLSFFSKYLEKHSLLPDEDMISVYITDEIKKANEILGSTVQRQSDIHEILKDRNIIEKNKLALLIDKKNAELKSILKAKGDLEKLQQLRIEKIHVECELHESFHEEELMLQMERDLRIDLRKHKMLSESEYAQYLNILESSASEYIDEKRKDHALVLDLEGLQGIVADTSLLIDGLQRIREMYNEKLKNNQPDENLTPKQVSKKIKELCELNHNGATFKEIHTNIVQIRKKYATKKPKLLQLIKDEIPKQLFAKAQRRAVEA